MRPSVFKSHIDGSPSRLQTAVDSGGNDPAFYHLAAADKLSASMAAKSAVVGLMSTASIKGSKGFAITGQPAHSGGPGRTCGVGGSLRWREKLESRCAETSIAGSCRQAVRCSPQTGGVFYLGAGSQLGPSVREGRAGPAVFAYTDQQNACRSGVEIGWNACGDGRLDRHCWGCVEGADGLTASVFPFCASEDRRQAPGCLGLRGRLHSPHLRHHRRGRQLRRRKTCPTALAAARPWRAWSQCRHPPTLAPAVAVGLDDSACSRWRYTSPAADRHPGLRPLLGALPPEANNPAPAAS